MSDDQSAFYQKKTDQLQVFLNYHRLYFELFLHIRNDLRFRILFILGFFTKKISKRFRQYSRSAAFNLVLNKCVLNDKINHF